MTTRLDQFYTTDNIAQYCFNIVSRIINLQNYDIILEPSAGKGAFLKLFPIDKRIGLDLQPKYEDIIRQDFFTYTPQPKKSYIVIGNPPFGKNCSLAIKFFNHASIFSDYICFIVPRTFKRTSIENKLNQYFYLIYNEDLPLDPCCFQPKINAKCCFQIWEKQTDKRPITQIKTSHPDFHFVPYGPLDTHKQPTVPTNVHFAIKAYGSNCGFITFEMSQLRPKSWHFIKSNIELDTLVQRFNNIDYSISKDSCRQDSLGKRDLVYLYERLNAKNP